MINDVTFGFDFALADDLYDDDTDDLFNTSAVQEDKTINPYLLDAKKGLELISSLLHVNESAKLQMRDKRRLDHLIDERLLQSMSRVHVKNEVELHQSLVKLTDKLYEHNKLRLLRNKLTVGIGGQFSAGKSKFINAVLEDEVLPEDQKPTTSIATYLVKGSDFFVEAITQDDQRVSLNKEAVQALSHEFYEKYQLGFSQFIKNLVISAPAFPYESIALLDTPGYSKSDTSKKQAISDHEKALLQLKSVDYLIWLVDIENGVIKKADIEFIESLGMKKPILFVFNKADKVSEARLAEVLEHTRVNLESSQLSIYAVIGYSSLEKKEYLGTNELSKFFAEINQRSTRQRSIESEYNSIQKKLESELEKIKEQLLEEKKKLANYITRSEDVTEVKSLTEVYATVLQQMRELQMCKRRLQGTREQITKQFALLKSRGAL